MVFDEQIKKTAIGSALSLGSTALVVPSFLLNGPNVINVTGATLAVGAGVYALSRAIKMKLTDEKIKKVMETEEYKEYASLYREYVNDIARMFNELGFKADLSSCVAYVFCLGKGIFSEDQVYKVGSFKESFDYFPRTLGARVATGVSCCRHNASLLSDIINEMGGTAATISGTKNYPKQEHESFFANHMVTGLIHDDKKIIVDANQSLPYMLHYGLLYFDDELIDLGLVEANSCEGDINFYKKRSNLDYSLNDARFNKIMKSPSYLDKDEIINMYVLEVNKCFDNSSQFLDFHNEEKVKIKQLARLNERITKHRNAE